MTNIDVDVIPGELQVFIRAGQVNGDIRIVRAKLAQTAQQPCQAKSGRRVNAQHRVIRFLHHLLGGAANRAHGRRHVTEVLFPGLRKQYAFAAADEQLFAQPGFQRRNLMAHRRWCDVKLLGRLVNAQGIGDRQERLNISQRG